MAAQRGDDLRRAPKRLMVSVGVSGAVWLLTDTAPSDRCLLRDVARAVYKLGANRTHVSWRSMGSHQKAETGKRSLLLERSLSISLKR